MSKIISQRFIIYPVLFMAIWYVALTKYYDSEIIREIEKMFIQPYIQAVGIDMSFQLFIAIYGFLFGYVYGTISQVLKARSFSGITLLVVFVIKFFVSAIGVIFAIFAFSIELILLPFFIMFKKKYVKKKEDKKNNKLLEQFREIVREEHAKYNTNNQQTSYSSERMNRNEKM